MAYKAEHYCEDDMCSVKYSGINAILSSNWTLSCKLFSQVKMEIINRYLSNFQEKVEEEYFLWKGFSHVCSMSQTTATEWKTGWILKEKNNPLNSMYHILATVTLDNLENTLHPPFCQRVTALWRSSCWRPAQRASRWPAANAGALDRSWLPWCPPPALLVMLDLAQPASCAPHWRREPRWLHSLPANESNAGCNTC